MTDPEIPHMEMYVPHGTLTSIALTAAVFSLTANPGMAVTIAPQLIASGPALVINKNSNTSTNGIFSFDASGYNDVFVSWSAEYNFPAAFFQLVEIQFQVESLNSHVGDADALVCVTSPSCHFTDGGGDHTFSIPNTDTQIGYLLFGNPHNLEPGDTVTLDPSVYGTPAPIPAAFPLFATGLGVIGLIARRRKRK